MGRSGREMLTLCVFVLLSDGDGLTLGFVAWLTGHVAPDLLDVGLGVALHEICEIAR